MDQDKAELLMSLSSASVMIITQTLLLPALKLKL